MSETKKEKCVSGDGIFVYRIENGAVEMMEYEGAAQRLLLPAYVSGCPLRVIGKKAFAGKRQLAEICLPDTVERIGDWAFAGCHRLKEITLPKKQLYLGRQLFGKCTALQYVFLPDRTRSLARLLASAVTQLEAEYLLQPLEAGTPGWFQSLDRRLLEYLKETEETALRDLVYCAEEDMLAKQQACLRDQIRKKIRMALLRLSFPDRMEAAVRRVLTVFLQERMDECREEIWDVIENGGEEQFLYCDVLVETGLIGDEIIGKVLEELGENHVELRAYLLKKWQNSRKSAGIWEQLQL